MNYLNRACYVEELKEENEAMMEIEQSTRPELQQHVESAPIIIPVAANVKIAIIILIMIK